MFRRFVNRNRAGVSLTRNSLAPPIPNNPKQTTILTFHYPLNRVLLHDSPNILSNEERVLILIYILHTVYYIYYAENTVAFIPKRGNVLWNKRVLVLSCTTLYIHINRGSPERNTVLVLLITDATDRTRTESLVTFSYSLHFTTTAG